MHKSIEELGRIYREDGFITGIEIISEQSALEHRRVFERRREACWCNALQDKDSHAAGLAF